jgi:hypothetical protein
MQRVKKADDDQHAQHDQRTHPRTTVRDLAPGRAQVLAPADVPCARERDSDQDEDQRIGPQDNSLERHQLNLTRGSAMVYDTSVMIRPMMYNTEPRNTIARTTRKSCCWMASIV